MKLLKLLAALFFFSSISASFAQADANVKQKIKVFLLAGQSNMDGRGDGSKLSQQDLLALKRAQKNVLFAYNGKAAEPLYVTTPLAHIQKKFALEKTFGPELFFGIGLSQAFPEEKILLIKRSLGGSSLYGCWNPNWTAKKASLMNELNRPKLYSELISDIHRILSDYNKEEYEICGMLWVQGETDSSKKKWGPKPADTYEENLKTLISSIREEVGDKNLPFLMLQVGSGKVVDAMSNISQTVKNVSFIPQNKDKKSSRYLPTYGPPIGHYTYDGMKTIGLWFKDKYLQDYGQRFEKSAPKSSWRKEANERIDKYRKSKLSIQVLDADNKAVSGAEVHIKLLRHQFHFGAAVKSNFLTSTYTKIYRENFLKYFNSGGFDLCLKPKQRGKPSEESAEKAMYWFQQNKIPMRGHNLVWEGEKFIRPEQRKILHNKHLSKQEKGEKLLAISKIHFPHAIKKWDVMCWDVVNEPYRNHLINDFLEMNTFSYWFKLADSLRMVYHKPELKLFLNENKIISNPLSGEENKPEVFKAILDEMLADGAPIDGLGFQSRIKNGYLPPDTLYARLCEFDKYNLIYQATEFEVRDTRNYQYSDEQKKQIVDELLTVYFSHPKVQGIWYWTFANNEKGNTPWALFNYDGTPSVFGEQWIKMMENDFNTDSTLNTNTSGAIDIRAFKGKYEIAISYNGFLQKEYINLTQDQDFQFKLKTDH